MKKIDVLINSVMYLIYVALSCAAAMIIEAGITKIISLCFVIDYFTLTVIRAVIYVITVFTLLFILSFHEGYKDAHFSAGHTVVSALLAAVSHFLFSLLFKFSAFISGGTKFISALIFYGKTLIEPKQTDSLGYGTVIPVFIVLWLFYATEITVAKYFGAKKRLLDRASLTANEKSAE